MKTVKVNEATNIQLDWLVAIATGAQQVKTPEAQRWMLHWPSPRLYDQPMWSVAAPKYTADWSQMGPIIEREKVNLVYRPDINCVSGEVFPRWIASVVTHGAEGPTPLIAAARCYVVSKLGETAEVPEELT